MPPGVVVWLYFVHFTEVNTMPKKFTPRRRTVEQAEARYCFVTRPRCPSCGSGHLASYRSTTEGEITTRYTRCQSCNLKFLVILE
jgi:hypothetical protein